MKLFQILYEKTHRQTVANIFLFTPPNHSLLFSVPLELDPDKPHPWVFWWLTSFWVWPMPEREDGKRVRQEYFFFLLSRLQCSISGHYQHPPWLWLCQAVCLPAHHFSPGYINLFPPFSTLGLEWQQFPTVAKLGVHQYSWSGPLNAVHSSEGSPFLKVCSWNHLTELFPSRTFYVSKYWTPKWCSILRDTVLNYLPRQLPTLWNWSSAPLEETKRQT